MRRIFKTSDYAIDNSGKTLVTRQLQELIDTTALYKGELHVEQGIYLVSSLFLKSDMKLILEQGAVLQAISCEEEYPVLPTRVAGIEMPWYVGVLNCISAENVEISGEGIIDGGGPYWWKKYWGTDTKSGMRGEYDRKGLRWACDYDCMRPRNVVICHSRNIWLKGFTSYQSGFWNVHILYSSYVEIDGIHILSKEKNSPSTDGIDIDSSHHVEVKNCILECNDDSICIKSGRDYDGLRVNIKSYAVYIHDCTVMAGFGITIGSEVSGGIEDITIKNIRYFGTDCGFRIKSSEKRKGYIRHIVLDGLTMHNVKYLFHFYLNWNPEYSACHLPKECETIPEHWRILCREVPLLPNTIVEDIRISNVVADFDEKYTGISRAFHIEGFADSPIKNICFKDMDIRCKEYGILSYVKNLEWLRCRISCLGRHEPENDKYDNR